MKEKHTFPVEIHTHTNHSDGHFTPQELVEASIDFGYKGMILTDHNSSSGYNEMLENGLNERNEILLLKGMEWTTYFGHMLVHEANYDADWREATPDTIDEYMQEVKNANGLVGIAHPFDMGSPICTGCHWDFQVKDYGLVDYIEVWNSNQPQRKPESHAAYKMWLQKLAEGYEISASSGRDWHRLDNQEANMGVTYVEVEENELTKANFKQALAKGSFYITLGPTAGFKITKDETVYYIGDRISTEAVSHGVAHVVITPTELQDLKQFQVTNFKFTIWNNQTKIFSSERIASLNEPVQFNVPLSDSLNDGYLRYEVEGQFGNDQDVKIIIGNPIYIH